MISSTKDGLNVAIKEMEENGISSVFAVDRQRRVQGIVTIEDAIQGIKEKKSLADVLNQDYMIVDKDEYINDLIQKELETKFPLAVINEEEKLVGFILRVHVLSGLVDNNDSP